MKQHSYWVAQQYKESDSNPVRNTKLDLNTILKLSYISICKIENTEVLK